MDKPGSLVLTKPLLTCLSFSDTISTRTQQQHPGHNPTTGLE